MAKKIKNKVQTMSYRKLHRKLKIEQHEDEVHYKPGVKASTPQA
jgi:hypothetical protein